IRMMMENSRLQIGAVMPPVRAACRPHGHGRWRHATLYAALALSVLTAPHGRAENDAPDMEAAFRDKFISLGTASRSGSFFPIGSRLCELVNQDRRKNLVRCVAY